MNEFDQDKSECAEQYKFQLLKRIDAAYDALKLMNSNNGRCVIQ